MQTNTSHYVQSVMAQAILDIATSESEYKSPAQHLSVASSNFGRKNKNMVASNIIMVKAESNYSYIYLKDGTKIFTSRTLKHWQGLLDESDFVRIHRSYLVNPVFVDTIDKKSKGVTLANGIKVFYARSFRRNPQLAEITKRS